MNTAAFTAYREKVVSNCARVIVGKEDATEKILVSFLCGGHVLLEDKPGTGKTMLLRAFARTVGGSFKRVQFTPDLLPSDLTGINFYNQKSGEFEFRPGPLFTNFVLADEINRATYGSLVEIGLKRQTNPEGKDYSVATFKRLGDFHGEQLAAVRKYALSFREQIRGMNRQRIEAKREQDDGLCEVESYAAAPAAADDSFCIGAMVNGDTQPLPA